MFFRATFFGSIVLLALVLELTAARSLNHFVRQDDGAQATPAASASQAISALTTVSVHGSSSSPLASSTASSSAPDSQASSPASTSSSSSTATSSSSNGGDEASETQSATEAASPTATDMLNGSPLFNATIPAGQLPLAPKLTPGWGVAGVVMLTTGLIYTLVGIKKQWVHTFFSTAYMTALGIAVLIMYVMSVPVSNAVQGGFVVAVVVSGCLVGAASMFFKELTEGLGCALGGFCISMWLLCLVPGGLLHPVAAKAIFIAAFTVVGFALYFSRWTRDWALIILISFAGATISVLGIDCFSRAGLKEFWVYIWNINSELFPLGADTYPVTKGIRVETAGIVIIFLMGIISQIKLWRIVREKRQKRAVERAEGQRTFDIEEAAVGRQVEEANARDRRQWERVYGDGTIGSSSDSRVSDLGDCSSEKRLQESRSESCKPRSSLEVIEMAHVPEPDAHDAKFTVRVGVDDISQAPVDDLEEEKATTAVHHSASTRSRHTATSRRVSSQAQTITEAPTVVPLPFSVPVIKDSDTSQDEEQDGRSSVATFAEDGDALGPPQRHESFYKRLSRGSASLLRSLSQRSGRGGDEVAPTPPTGSSSEELVIPRQQYRRDDDNGSLAATVDIDSDSMSGGDVGSLGTPESRRSIEMEAKESSTLPASLAAKTNTSPCKMQSPASSPAKTILHHSKMQSPASSPAKTNPQGDDDAASVSNTPKHSPRPKSGISIASTRASLTKEKLPASLSKVALSYRTNEWAKHLSYADVPNDPPDDASSADDDEPAERTAPLDAVELQKTAQDGAPLPAMSIRRSESQASMASFSPTVVSKRASKPDLPAAQGLQERESQLFRLSPASQAHQDRESQLFRLSPASQAHQDRESQSSRLASPLRRVSSRPEGLPTSYSASSLPQERDLSAKDVTSIEANSRSPASLRTPTRRASSGFQPIVQERRTTMQADAIPEEPAEAARPISVGPSQRSSAISGVVSYANPQTLLGQRELLLRNKSQGSLVVAGPGSDSGSGSPRHSLTAYPPSQFPMPDPDDLPLSQRRQIMRQSSLMSLPGSNPWPAAGPHESSENLPFNSHQPRRSSGLPSSSSREAQLANFRQSVLHDLRAGTPLLATQGRETPFKPTSLLANRDAEVQRNIEMQRNVLIGQKEAEAQRRERERLDRENADRIFDERMRNGNLIEAHREAMRRMQRAARNQ
ncbi:hypothetical protein CDD81_179 [Ophiocordyceps australis]|uniref:TM7S3/TM198-like domain-containing protein n=1 Tax=Ophiocordyceps australis TaxID=1399860 RepID=A0A2C5YEI5_9HYPO|nr:hypothetical protein CDD81_179 [Ophiocordyceps australis]